ncbi:MAG: hypothetical protein QW253_00005 [Metallosphaera sp.]
MNEEKILVKIDRHEANKTSARTWWTIKLKSSDDKEVDINEALTPLFSTHKGGKTHWHEYYLVPVSAILIRHRISNRGNYSRSTYTPQDVKASWDEIPPLLGERDE